jgi:hypothetical protein
MPLAPGTARRASGVLLLFVIFVLAAGVTACRRADTAPAEETIETVDVGEGIDSNIRPEDDQRAEVRERGLLGVLPGDFPRDLWVYEPASIVDFGAAEGSRSFVALRAVAAPERVAQRLRSEESARGWQVEAATGTLLTFSKGGRRVEAELEQRGNETWIRIEYPPS